MQGFGKFIWASVAGGGLAASLMVIAAVLARSQLAHWLNRDIESIKSRHQQELEAYKVSLIAETERMRAQQDVKKAMALLIAEMKFAAMQGMMEAAGQMGVMLAYARACHSNGWDVNYMQIALLGSRLHAAVTRAKPFLQPDHHDSIISYANAYFEGVNRLRLQDAGEQTCEVELIFYELGSAQAECDQIITGHMDKMLGMT